jgi:thiol-disulfide isomerase/thioredoxin
MKQFFSLMAAAMISMGAFAQLPDGSVAPDWTATDINGVEHNLQSYLDQGMTVILDFSATWCGPCWAYHNTHILRDLYDTFGPDGTGDLMVFYMEGDDTTTQADLEGTGTATAGDWITGTTYPIIDNTGSIFDDYAGAYYPTIYTICPDGILTESGQVSFEDHVAAAFGDCENAITGAAPLCSYNGATASCGGAAWMASTEMTNLGSENVTSATFEVTLNGNTDIVNWTGDVATGGSATVELGEYTETGDLNVTLVEVNMMDWAAAEDVTIIGSVESTTYVQVRITTDNWPTETGWVINDDMGNEIASVAVGSLTDADTPFTWDVGLGDLGCYTFTMYDAYGDGLYASQWGNYADGTAGVYSMDGELEVGVVFEYDGASGIEFSEANAGMEAATVAGIAEGALSSTVNVFPNPTNGVTNVEFNTKEAGMATVEVYNLIGERVVFNTLGNLPAGLNRANLDLSGVEAGIYLVNLNAGGETSTLRITKQ